jgi:hypothetical protein
LQQKTKEFFKIYSNASTLSDAKKSTNQQDLLKPTDGKYNDEACSEHKKLCAIQIAQEKLMKI